MQPNIFTLCDFAQIMANKLVIIGTFDFVGTKESLPITVQLYAALRLEIRNSDAGNHLMAVEIRNVESKTVIASQSMLVRITTSTDSPEPRHLQLFMHFPEVRFDRLGYHSVHLTANGKQLSELALHIQKG